MLELLNSILQFIISIRTLIKSFFTGLITLFESIPTYINFISNTISVLPPFLLPFATRSLSLSVMLFVLNKD